MSNYSLTTIPDTMNYAVINTDTGVVYECENYRSALNLRREIGGVIVNSHSTTGIILIVKYRKAWNNY